MRKRRFRRSLDTRRLHTWHFSSFHATLPPQERQRKILAFSMLVTLFIGFFQRFLYHESSTDRSGFPILGKYGPLNGKNGRGCQEKQLK